MVLSRAAQLGRRWPSCILALAALWAGGAWGAPRAFAAPSEAQAARFLGQATFGPTDDSVAEVRALGFANYLDKQINGVPASSYLDFLDQHGIGAEATSNIGFMQAWWQYAINAPDQLRQRVAFAWSEIMVVSGLNANLSAHPDAMAAYLDILSRNAFGNYRQLLQEVALSPTMGRYLNLALSDKGDPLLGAHPNENFAREVLQLFSIGLHQLTPSGSTILDANRLPISTYTQETVLGFAQAFSGWNAVAPNAPPVWKYIDKPDWRSPMASFPAHHATGAKQLLGTVVLPPGQTPERDMKDALNTIFYQGNVGPFIAKRLIQRLVTSNPSPPYIGRITAVFNDDGHGVRGNLAAVTTAILLDSEARQLPNGAQDLADYGHQFEPLLRVVHVMRAFHAAAPSGLYSINDTSEALGQTPLRAPSVFNFFPPDYTLAGGRLLAPEFAITTANTAISTANYMSNMIYNGIYNGVGPGHDRIMLDLSPLSARAQSPTTLVSYLNLLLLANTMSPDLQNILVNAVTSIPSTDANERARTALLIVATSPAFVIGK